MAAIAPTRANVGRWQIYTWTGVTESDTFAAAPIDGPVSQVTFQSSDTFGGATLIAQGSNDNVNFVALDDVEDAAISHTAAGGSELRYAWPYMRPNASGGSSQSLTVTMAVMAS